jgi:hypothetical protein
VQPAFKPEDIHAIIYYDLDKARHPAGRWQLELNRLVARFKIQSDR